MIKKDAHVTSILTARKPGSMDEITFALASYDNGVTLSSVGFEMISSVLRAAHVKYGDSQVRPIINRAIRPAGDVDLHSAYMRCFPRYPATLDMILSNLKVGIMDLKK